jgi:hypothetical protein
MKLVAFALLLHAFAACSSNGDDRAASESRKQSPKAQASQAAAPHRLQLDFEQAAEGAAPAGWTVAETLGAGKPATWTVRAAPGGGRAVHVATANQGGTFNLLLSPETYPADLEVGVRVRADSGAEDQGGGLLWRAQGPDDYYIARWNPLEGNVRVYKVVGGARTMLQNADTDAAADGWHTLTATAIGERMQIALDGAVLLETQDAAIAKGGRVGLWTKADAATWFDDIQVGEPSWPDER